MCDLTLAHHWYIRCEQLVLAAAIIDRITWAVMGLAGTAAQHYVHSDSYI